MRRHGFTLIESVLSLGILSIGLLGVIYAFHGMGESSVLADQTVVAGNIARGAIERVIAKRDASGYAATLSAISGGSFNQNPVPNYPPYALTASTYEVDADKDAGATDDFLDALPGSGYARVTVNVTWNTGKNSMNLVTLIANH